MAGTHDSTFVIEGSNNVTGEVIISGSKNAGLPIMIASLLCRGKSVLLGIPPLSDILSMGQILEHLGVTIAYGTDSISIDTSDLQISAIPQKLTGRLRASILLLGPLAARYGRVKMGLPGGCDLGNRCIQDHVEGLWSLSIKVIVTAEGIEAIVKGGVCSGPVYLRKASVTTTMSVMMAACYGRGTTRIVNAAKDPEIADLAKCLTQMGFDVKGAGTSCITVNGISCGSEVARPYSHKVIRDRIEAGTFLVFGAMAGCPLVLRGCNLAENITLVDKLRLSGADIQEAEDGSVLVHKAAKPTAVNIETYTYPMFPTDLQPLFMAYMATTRGVCTINERMFAKRFNQVEGLVKMGANIDLQCSEAVVTGTDILHGAEVVAPDLRAGAALVLLAAVAKGTSAVRSVEHLDRGYYRLECKLQGVGVNIKRIQ